MTRRAALAILASLLLLLAAIAAGGCDTGADTGVPRVPEGVNPDPTLGPGQYVLPAEPDLSTPESSVISYLDWVSFAYRMANSDVATHTFSPFEEVRVNAYVELNRQQNRAIDQRVTSIDLGVTSTDDQTATVTAREDWEYRYFSLDTIEWLSELNTASYETTYVVLLQPDGTWLVDSVEANALTEVP